MPPNGIRVSRRQERTEHDHMSARDAQSEQRVRGIRHTTHMKIHTHLHVRKFAVDRVSLASDSRLVTEGRNAEERRGCDALEAGSLATPPAPSALLRSIIRERKKTRLSPRPRVPRINGPRRRPADCRTTTSSRRRRARASNHTERAYRRDLTRTTEHG